MTTKKTSVIGFPRIGKKRELKFASEKFFKGEVSENELRKVAAEIRLYGWQKQQEAAAKSTDNACRDAGEQIAQKAKQAEAEAIAGAEAAAQTFPGYEAFLSAINGNIAA